MLSQSGLPAIPDCFFTLQQDAFIAEQQADIDSLFEEYNNIEDVIRECPCVSIMNS